MKEFELGKEIAQLSNRISLLESRILRSSTDGEDFLLGAQPLDDVFLGDEVAFDFDRNVVPGSCPATYKADWKNKKVEFKVCAKSGDEAAEEANDQLEKELKKLIRDAAGLDCTSRSGCAAPATCKEEFGRIKATLLGNWNCVDSRKQGDCKEGETEWTCTGWFNIKCKLECKCTR